MKMGSSMWKFKYRVKRNPKWLLTPLLVMVALLLIRMMFAWKAVGYFFLCVLLAGCIGAVYFLLGNVRRKLPLRRMKWKK